MAFHQRSAVLVPLLFYAHSVQIGYGYLAVLSWVFLGNMVVGVASPVGSGFAAGRTWHLGGPSMWLWPWWQQHWASFTPISPSITNRQGLPVGAHLPCEGHRPLTHPIWQDTIPPYHKLFI